MFVGVHIFGLIFFYLNKPAGAFFIAILASLLGISRYHHWRGKIEIGSRVIIFGLWFIYMIVVFLAGNLDSVLITLPFSTIAMAIILLGVQTGFVLSLLTGGITLVMVVLEATGSPLPVLFPGAPVANWLAVITAISMMFPPLNQALKGLNMALQRTRHAEEEVRKLNTELEHRVAQRTAELQAANENLRSFSYSVAHDLKAPLRAIAGYSNILEADYAAHLDDEGLSYLLQINKSSLFMNALIEDLLTFSQLSQQEIHMQLVDTGKLIPEILARLQPQLDKMPTQIQVADDLPSCEADLNLLILVFTNLLDNAIKYSHKRTNPIIDLGWQRDKEELVFYVKDNGVGFDMQYAGKIFGVFQRLHSASEYEGTGVGLAIVQRIVQQHGGRIWVEAKEDKGATFYFTVKES